MDSLQTNEMIARLRHIEDEVARLQAKVRNLIHTLQEDLDRDDSVL